MSEPIDFTGPVRAGPRPTADEYFMGIARLVAQRTTCVRRAVGALLVRDNQILATGYNGAPRGLPHCTAESCQRLNARSGERLDGCFAVHAETNCIIQAAVHGTKLEPGSTLYCTAFPCVQCLKMLINAGVARIVYDEDYDMGNPFKRALLAGSGIAVLRCGGARP